MDINTKINVISGVIIPSASLIGAMIGFLVGIFKQRNDVKWKENREALQCAYACCEDLKRRVSKNLPLNTKLIDDLKYYKCFNIADKNIFKKVTEIIEFGICNPDTLTYIESKKDEYVTLIGELLPLIKNKLNK